MDWLCEVPVLSRVVDVVDVLVLTRDGVDV